MWPLPFPLPPLWVCTAIAGLAAGVYGTHTWHKAQQVDAIETARKAERGLQRTASQADVRYVDRLIDQRTHAERNATAWEKELHDKNYELAKCRISGGLVGLLDDAGQLPGAAGHPAQPGPGAAAAAAAPDSTCDIELGRCRANYAEVCVPNAIHVRELRDFTRGLIRDYNRATGRD